jgi:ABC transporter substrate binding protein
MRCFGSTYTVMDQNQRRSGSCGGPRRCAQTSFWPLAALWHQYSWPPRTVPIVFAFAADPVGSGFVESLSRPGGNATGFLMFEYDLSAKWLELLKEVAPGVTRAAVLRDATAVTGIGQFAVIQSVARSVGADVSPLNLRDTGEIERGVTAFARSSNGGLIVAASVLASVQRNLIVELAAPTDCPRSTSNACSSPAAD